MKWLRTFLYFLRIASRGIMESGSAALVAVATISIALLILGGFLLALSNTTRLLNDWGEQIRLVTYLNDGLSDFNRERLRRDLAAMGGVYEVRYISKEEALRDFRKHLGSRAEILDGLRPNPLPAAFVVSLRPENRNLLFVSQMAATIRGRTEVESVDFGQAWVESFERVVREFKWIIAGVGVFLGFGIVLIVSNTIRLALYSRQEEVEIMDLVGATPGFIRAPFLVEGFLEGLGGSVLSLAALYGLYRLVLFRAAHGFPSLGSDTVTFLEPAISIGLLFLGTFLGVIGSLLSVSRYPGPRG